MSPYVPGTLQLLDMMHGASAKPDGLPDEMLAAGSLLMELARFEKSTETDYVLVASADGVCWIHRSHRFGADLIRSVP